MLEPVGRDDLVEITIVGRVLHCATNSYGQTSWVRIETPSGQRKHFVMSDGTYKLRKVAK